MSRRVVTARTQHQLRQAQGNTGPDGEPIDVTRPTETLRGTPEKPVPIYRGLNIDPDRLPPELLSQIKADLGMALEPADVGRHFKVGPAILDWLQQNHWERAQGQENPAGLGRHWTTRPSMAQMASGVGGGIPVILRSQWDGSGIDEGREGEPFMDAENEITMLRGAPLSIDSVQYGKDRREVLHDPDEGERIRNSYGNEYTGGPRPHTAAIFPPHDDGWDRSHLFDPSEPKAVAPADARWYHTSPQKLKPGDRLRPFGGDRQYPNMYDSGHGRQHRDQHIWTEHSPFRVEQKWSRDGSPYIYEIEPDEAPQPWNETAADGWVTPGATIKRVLTENGWLPQSFHDEEFARTQRSFAGALREAEAQEDMDLLRDPRGVPPGYFTGIHEMGHGLDFAGDFIAGRPYDIAAEVYRKQFPDRKPWGPGDSQFREWVRGQLPRAAFQPGDDWFLDDREAFAHAFTEVMLNPQANELSRALNDALVKSQEGRKPHGPLSVGPGVPESVLDAISDVQAKHPAADINRVDLIQDQQYGPAFMQGPGPFERAPFKDEPPRMRIDQQYANPAEPLKFRDWFDDRIDEGHYPRWQSTTAGEPWPEDHIEDVMTEFDSFRGRTASADDYHPHADGEYHPRYEKAHDQITDTYGQPQACERCGDTDPDSQYEWATVGDPNTTDIDNYERLCKKCHNDEDGVNAYQQREGMAFPPGYEVKRKQMPSGYGGVDLYDPDGRDIGGLNWYDDNDEVAMIDIDEDYRRRGLATELFNHVKGEIRPYLQHSDELTPDGAAFAKSMGWDPSPGGEDSIFNLQFEARTVAVLADPDGAGVWRTACDDRGNQTIEFIPRPT